MRKLMLGILLAAGAAVPTMATAQDEGHRPDNGRKWADGAQEPRVDGNRQRAEQSRPAPQAAPQPRPQPQAAPQAQVQAQAQGRFDGRGGGDGARFNGGARFDGGGRPGGGGPDRAAQDQAQAQAQAAAQARAQAQAQDQARYRGQQRGPDGYGQRPNYQPGYRGPDNGQNGFNQNRAPQPGYRAPQGVPGSYAPGQRPQDYSRQSPQYRQGGQWSRGWRDDGRYDWGRYRVENRSAFHLPRYYAPRGWSYGYRRFSAGFTLSAVLFDEGFWIDDPFYYRLPPAYGPYRWVRYYNDALLVDVRNGYVVDTVYDIFW